MANWFAADPIRNMAEFKDDDQHALKNIAGRDAIWAQDHYVDQIVTYKIHIETLGVRPDNRIVMFHGIPRPWDLDLPWIPKLC